MAYTYKLHKNNLKKEAKRPQGRYQQHRLEAMTVYQLRDICQRERLVKSTLNLLNKDELIRLIMRYRGATEGLFIKTHHEEGLKRLQRFISKAVQLPLEGHTIHSPSKLVLYEGLNVEIFDNYLVRATGALDEGNVILVDGNGQISTIFNLVLGDNGNYYLTKSAEVAAVKSTTKHYRLLYLDREQSELIYHIYYGTAQHIPQYLMAYGAEVLDFNILSPMETDIPLAIDFGTSNTTAGIYLNQESFHLLNQGSSMESLKINDINGVAVLNTTVEPAETTPLIPSVVGIRAIEENEIDYVFGYEALRYSKLSYIDEGICIFYDIKRWVSDYDREEKITDLKGRSGYVKRSAIIKAFLEYIIGLAKQRFKCNFKNIHISSPSKQKYRFYRLFQEVLSDYEVAYEDMLDEGAAVLFNTIHELIDKKSYQEGAPYRALIIDCGGGTTDLSSCEFRIYNNRVSYEIDIETAYENGDTDFGGNNLTYRLLQLIKIVFASILTGKGQGIKEELLKAFDVDLFRHVDEYGSREIYLTLEEAYDRAEEMIPTRFKDYESRSSHDYFKVKSNFYLLFELAEGVKKAFFKHKSLLTLKVNSEAPFHHGIDELLFDKWRLHIRQDGELKQLRHPLEATFSRYDIQTLLRADIYQIIKRFLEGIYERGQLFDYSIIKLTGQSCKIELFREALKEFVPGRLIQYGRNQKAHQDDHELKLTCLRGALKYLQAKKFGYINVNLRTRKPALPYMITTYTHRGDEKVLIHSSQRQNTQGHISRFMERITLKLYLKDANGNVRYEYEYENRPDDFVQTTYEEIYKRYKDKIIQDETDNIVDKEVKFFVWAREAEWGFCVVPVLREKEILYIGKEAFYSFENDTWEMHFFDGLK